MNESMDIIKLILLAVIVAAACLTTGCAAVKFLKAQIVPGRVFLYGEILLLASFELIAPWFYLFQRKLAELMVVWGSLVGILLVVSVWYARDCYAPLKDVVLEFISGGWNFWKICAGALLLAQIFLVWFAPWGDLDDWMFVGDATQAYGTGLLNQRGLVSVASLARFGRVKYFAAPFPIMTAVLSRLVSLHPMLTTHWLIAAITMVNVYLVTEEIARFLFRDKALRFNLYVWASLLSLADSIGYPYIRTRLYVAPWQGKSIMSCIMFPVLLLFALIIIKKGKKALYRDWLALAAGLLACMCCNAFGAVLGPVFAVCFGVGAAFFYKKASYIVKSLAVCIPELVVLAVMLLLQN